MIRKLKNFLKKAIITKDRSKKTDIQNQASYMGTEIIYSQILPYGLQSKAKKDSMVMLFSLNNNNSIIAGLEYDNKKLLDNFVEVANGEVGLYHPDTGSYILFKNNNDIKIVDAHNNTVELTSSGIKLKESSSGELNLSSGKVALGKNGGDEILDLVSQLCNTLSTDLGNLGYPLANAATYSTLKGKVDAIKGSL